MTVPLSTPFLVSCLFLFCFWFYFHCRYVSRLSEFCATVYLFPLEATMSAFCCSIPSYQKSKFCFAKGILLRNKLLLERNYCRPHVQHKVANRQGTQRHFWRFLSLPHNTLSWLSHSFDFYLTSFYFIHIFLFLPHRPSLYI